MQLEARLFLEEKSGTIWRYHFKVLGQDREITRFGLEFSSRPEEDKLLSAVNKKLKALPRELLGDQTLKVIITVEH